MEGSLSIFKPINPLNSSKYTLSVWKEAVSAYEKKMAPVESHIARILQSRLNNLFAYPKQICKEIEKYSDLVKRENIRRHLSTELETLVSQLVNQVKAAQIDISNRTIQIKVRNADFTPKIAYVADLSIESKRQPKCV